MTRLFSLLLFFCLIFLSSCAYPDHWPLHAAGSYSVPGMYYYDTKGAESEVEVIEVDSEGRTLFYYTAKNLFTGVRETAVVICQKAEQKRVYFYEDRCYLLSGYDQSDVEKLKQENDWGKPLDESKFSVRKFTFSYKGTLNNETHLEYGSVRKNSASFLGIDQSRVSELLVFDCDPKGNFLYRFKVDDELVYIALVKTNYDVSILEFNDEPGFIEELVAFKKQNGWVYGMS